MDEAGRGPLAGPVTAAAVMFPREISIPGVNDSKRLTAEVREKLAEEIESRALCWVVAEAVPAEIDRLNILGATRLAMERAVAKLSLPFDLCLADGYCKPDWEIVHLGIIKGDQRSFLIAAASILAKVHRDRRMLELHHQFPRYGFDRNKGYPTLFHRNALREYGPCDCHRRSFKFLDPSRVGVNLHAPAPRNEG